jgi:hypothetical protein
MRADVKQCIYEDLKVLKSDMQTLKRYKAQLQEICSKTTASYGLNVGGGGGGIPTSQTEKLTEKKVLLQDKISSLDYKIRCYNEAIACALTPLEREVVYEIIDGNRLSDYARRKDIYKSTVYKISDKAIIKIAKYIEEWTRRELT